MVLLRAQKPYGLLGKQVNLGLNGEKGGEWGEGGMEVGEEGEYIPIATLSLPE